MTEYTKLPVRGQGIFVFIPIVLDGNVFFHIYNKERTNGLKVQFTETNILVTIIQNNHRLNLADPTNNSGLLHVHGAYYWFSLDAQNQMLYAGIGEPRIETATYKYKLSEYSDKILEKIKLLLESMSHVEYSNIHMIRISKDPITDVIALKVQNTDHISMMDIAENTCMPKSNLSITSQKLYDCISGKMFILDDHNFPDFSEAIEYSIATEGCWCNTILKKKANEFNKDKPNIKETYIRITLGKNNGESPGIPYVMEIWPPNHFSPIHNHAGANAIIRVLHGEIHVKLYPFLCAEKDGIPTFGSADFKKGDITWISPTLNQTHQLVNHKSATCITIQCYMYDDENKQHYDYFDYIDAYGDKQQYEPDSDMDFVSFSKLIKQEWISRTK